MQVRQRLRQSLPESLRRRARKPLLAACDVYRPAAIKQLQVNGEKVGVPVFTMGDNQNPVNIAKAAVEHARKEGMNLVFLDTAGRLQIDESMMDELVNIKEAVEVDQTILVVDAMTGQDAVNVAGSFNDKIGVDGVILTKLDGDTRGGAALIHQCRDGKTDPLCRYGREALRSGTVLSRTYGFQDPWNGRCNESDREGGSICGSGTGSGDAKEAEENGFRLQ